MSEDGQSTHKTCLTRASAHQRKHCTCTHTHTHKGTRFVARNTPIRTVRRSDQYLLTVNLRLISSFGRNCARHLEMLRVRGAQSAMGVRHIWHLDLLGVLRQASRAWRASVIRAVRVDGQVEGHRIGENEGTPCRPRSASSCSCSIDAWLHYNNFTLISHQPGRR